MKTTYKLGIAALMASVLTYTGCVNALTEDADASASVSASHVAKGSTLSVSSIDFDGNGTEYSKATGRYVTVTFNAPVDEAAAQSAISFYRFSGKTALLSNYDYADYDYNYSKRLAAAVAASSYAETEVSKGTAIYSDDGKSVTFKLDLSEADALRVYVNPAVIESTAGAKFDYDGDKIFGESGDDDYSRYYYASSPSTAFDSTVFYAINKLSIGSAQFVDRFRFSSDTTVYARVDVDYWDSNTSYASLLSSNVKAQYYDTFSKKWVDIALSFALNTTDYTSDYYKYYTAAISKIFSTGTQLRLVTSNVQNLKTSTAVRGYVRRYDLNNNNSFKVLYSGYVAGENNVIADNLLSVSTATVDTIGSAGYKVNSITLYHNSDSDSLTYSTDSNYVSYETDIANVAGLTQGSKYYYDYGSETSNLYSWVNISSPTSAAAVAAKLHFYNVNGEEVSAKVTQSYYDNSDNLVIVFDDAITVPGSTLYVYAESDITVSYTRTEYERQTNSAYKGYYSVDADGNYTFYNSDDVEYYQYYYTVSTTTVNFTVGNDTDVASNTTGTALRNIATIDLSSF